MTDSELLRVAARFDTDGEITSVELYGSGHINYTYKATGTGKNYTLQKINTSLFTNPDTLMHNICLVTEYLRDTVAREAPDERVLRVVPTLDGKPYLTDESGTYRMYEFIDESVCYDAVKSVDDFNSCAFAFGRFATYLDGFDAKQLYEIIPNFHNTVDRMRKFKAALASDALDRAKDVEKEIKFFLDRESYCSKITSLLDSGEMPTRVTHNDTKLNNILFSEKTGKPLAIIDLDTVMPGSVCYDFGDSIRFGCNTAAEDEPDTDKVGFSTELFEAYVKGYLKGFDKITPIERKNLLWGAILMTYECGMRFLTDYLEGDTYFHTQRKGQNLDRARTQIRMVELMEKDFDKLQNIVDNA